MITIEDVQEVLAKEDLEFSDEVVGQVLAAEHGHQRSVLDIPSPRPEEVDQALVARVVHNLRTTDGEPVQRVGYEAETVTELEKPFRIRRASTPADLEPAPKTTARRAANKRTARKAANPKKES